MLESEKAKFSIEAEYLGVATLESLELELLKVKAVAECGYFKDLAVFHVFPQHWAPTFCWKSNWFYYFYFLPKHVQIGFIKQQNACSCIS